MNIMEMEMEMNMKNLQKVIDDRMKDAQGIWADDKDMQEMLFQDAVDAFSVMKDIEKGEFASAKKTVLRLDTCIMESILEAVFKDKGRDWTETTFEVEFA